MISKVCTALVVVLSSIEAISACNGYSLKLTNIKNCDPNSVIKIPETFEVSLDKDCNLVYSGCVNVTKPIKSSPGTYVVNKPPLPTLDGEVEFCEVIAQDGLPTVKQTLAAMGAPKKCPVPAKNYCSIPNNKVNIGIFKNQLGLAAGTTTAKLTANHDSGKTCVEMTINISKARKG